MHKILKYIPQEPVLVSVQIVSFLICVLGKEITSIEKSIQKLNETLIVENIFYPDIIPEGSLSIMKIKYRQKDVQTAEEKNCLLLRKKPELSWPTEKNCLYTLVVTGPDAPSVEDHEQSEYQHWISGNIPGCELNNGTLLTAYVGDVPNYRVCLHKLIFLAFKQPSKEPIPFNEEFLPRRPIGIKRMNFSTKNFTKKYNLGLPVAGNYFWMDVTVKLPDVGISATEL